MVTVAISFQVAVSFCLAVSLRERCGHDPKIIIACLEAVEEREDAVGVLEIVVDWHAYVSMYSGLGRSVLDCRSFKQKNKHEGTHRY